jgi:hypothetical protein
MLERTRESRADGIDVEQFPGSRLHVQALGRVFRATVSVLPGGRFKKGQENTMVFTISGDGHNFGDIEIGDVVLFYQRLVS